MFTVLRTIQFTIIGVAAFSLIKIAIFDSIINLICLLIPTIMYGVIFGVPRGLLNICSSSLTVHPISKKYEKEADKSSQANQQRDFSEKASTNQ